MKKIAIPLLFFISISNDAICQSLSPFGVISSEEKNMTECPFDKEADAVYFLYEAVARNDDYKLVTDYHIRLRILNDKAISEGDISIPYYSNDDFEYLKDIEAIVINYNEDGSYSKVPVDAKSIFTQKTDKYYSEKKFALPAVTKGSIIEYKYTSVQKSYAGLDYWYFQKRYPVVKSSYYLEILPGFEFAYNILKSPVYPIEIKKNNTLGTVLYSMSNIPGLNDEPYMESAKDYLQRVEFQLAQSARGIKFSTSWDQLAREMWTEQYFVKQLNDKLSGTEDLLKEIISEQPFKKMTAVYNYVRSNMNWNGYSSKYSSDGIKKAWSKKTGTSGDINLILINLLKASGLDTDPVLISERYHGKVYTQYPFADQFNTVYALVYIDGRKYYLDATNKTIPSGLLPYEILNTTGFIVRKKGSELIVIEDNNLKYKDFSNTVIKVNDNGSFEGECFFSSVEYAKADRLRSFKKDKTKYIAENFETKPSLSISGFETENDNTDSLPLKHKFGFEYPAPENKDYVFVPINLFIGTGKNPFIATNRFSNINFGYNQFFSSNITVSIPENYTIDVLPKNIKITNPDKTITCTRMVGKGNNNVISARLNIEFTKSVFTAEEYDNLKEFYKQLYQILDEQIVLKRK